MRLVTAVAHANTVELPWATTSAKGFTVPLPAGCRLDRVQQLPVARKNVHHAVRPGRGKQCALRVPREDHRPFPVVSRIDHKQRIHKILASPSLLLYLSPPLFLSVLLLGALSARASQSVSIFLLVQKKANLILCKPKIKRFFLRHTF